MGFSIGLAMLAFVLSFSVHAQNTCVPAGATKRSDLSRCTYLGSDGVSHDFYVLRAKGTFAEMSEDHGFLLGRHAESGPIGETLNIMDHELAQRSPLVGKLAAAIVNCTTRSLMDSVSDEFAQGVEAYGRGYRAQGGSRFSERDLRKAALAIEISNVAAALGHGDISPLEFFVVCPELTIPAIGTGMWSTVTSLFRTRGQKFGCTGVYTPAGGLNAGELHARNLDADLTRSYGQTPVLFLLDETGRDKRGRPFKKYVAGGSAGMIYPGGISGFNAAGISVSLHQMYATAVNYRDGKRRLDIAPFTAQRILREAESVQDAVELLENVKHIASWTYLVGDSKTGEVASIETSAKGIVVARRSSGQAMGQSNHFFSPAYQSTVMTPNFGKFLEAHARLITVDRKLAEAAGRTDVDWGIRLLSSHDDPYASGPRAFGRTVTKAYSVASHVMVPDQGEFWISGGEVLPAPHSAFLGFKVDFYRFTWARIGTKYSPVEIQRPNYRRSFSFYAAARMASLTGNYTHAISYLQQAIAEAARDGVRDSAYEYMLARTLHFAGRTGESVEAWKKVLELSARMYEYDIALAKMFYAMALFDHHRARRSLDSVRSTIGSLVEGEASASGVFKRFAQRYGHEETKQNLEATLELGRLLRDHRRTGEFTKWRLQIVEAVSKSDPDFVVIR